MAHPCRIVFLGTPDFAVPSLAALVEAGLAPALVVTQPARARGRGRSVSATSIAREAAGHGLPIRVWDRGDRREVTEAVRGLEPDFLVLAAFGKILRPDFLALPARAPLNLHPSLLPRYRGVSPIQAALRAGDPITGCSIIHMVDEADAGDVLLQEALAIDPRENAGELEVRLAEQGARLVVEAIRRWDTLVPRPQGDSPGPLTRPITGADGRIEWDRPVEEVHNAIRALNPKPGAFTSRRGRRLLVRRAFPLDLLERSLSPATLFALPDGFPCVVCSPGSLRLEEVQLENRASVAADAYLRGAPLEEGERLG